jgi:hypothetical protein
MVAKWWLASFFLLGIFKSWSRHYSHVGLFNQVMACRITQSFSSIVKKHWDRLEGVVFEFSLYSRRFIIFFFFSFFQLLFTLPKKKGNAIQNNFLKNAQALSMTKEASCPSKKKKKKKKKKKHEEKKSAPMSKCMFLLREQHSTKASKEKKDKRE